MIEYDKIVEMVEWLLIWGIFCFRILESQRKSKENPKKTFKLGQHWPMYEKISQKWTSFAFGSKYHYQTFTECVSNQYTHFNISTYHIWLQVMEHSLILLGFWVFLYIIDHSCLNFCISIKFSLIVYLINT